MAPFCRREEDVRERSGCPFTLSLSLVCLFVCFISRRRTRGKRSRSLFFIITKYFGCPSSTKKRLFVLSSFTYIYKHLLRLINTNTMGLPIPFLNRGRKNKEKEQAMQTLPWYSRVGICGGCTGRKGKSQKEKKEKEEERRR